MPRLPGRENPNTLVLTADLLIESVHDSVWGWARPGRCKVVGCERTTETWEREQIALWTAARAEDRDGMEVPTLWARICRPGNWDSGPFAWICPPHYRELDAMTDDIKTKQSETETYDAPQ
jgi:hypothetical protein